MALNLKTLATRSISAAVFVVVLVACVLWNYASFSIFFLAVSLLGLNEFYRISQKLGANPFKITGYICAVLVYFVFIDGSLCPFIHNFQKAIAPMLPVIFFMVFVVGLFSKEESSTRDALYTIGGIVYSVLPFALLNQVVFYKGGYPGNHFSPWLVMGIIFLIWSNDTFAYIGGSLFGKNKIIERVSPGKTWEGTAIGILVTFGLSFAFNTFVYRLDPVMWPFLGVVIPLLATIGDLVESKLKREAGIKDSGNLMPGHGGILDRFDSLIFVSPFVYALFYYA